MSSPARRKVAVATLGCKVNQFESAAFLAGFREQGCEIVSAAGQAEVFVINTCAVTARASQQSRQLIRRIARDNPAARIVVTGCHAETATAELQDLVPGQRLIVLGNAAKDLAVSTALAAESGHVVLPEIGAAKEICQLPLVRRFSGRTRAFLRVQDGCNNFCSYCIVPYARGRSRSLPLAAVLAQTRLFVAEGCRELVVTGINVGKYGLDLTEGLDIYALLETLCREFPAIRLRLSSIEPTEVNDRLLRVLSEHNNFMPHFHIPLQSGDSGVLARMNRRYTAETFAAAVHRLHSVAPQAALGCDILAGFPGEDEQAADNSYNLLAGLPISYLHVFPYSIRPGTAAAQFTDQVPVAVKEERVDHLRTLDRQKRLAFYQQHLGTEQQVLVEHKDKKTGLLKGFTENYIPVQLRSAASLAGTVVAVRLVEMRDGAVLGTIES
ncbi:tRNA (N(6)-L-threonylcarbamoyladenosine(37)-C(2))-methylthiotransferase MtaB [Candidatus Electronema sp. PJ]|uniref:tRNA (N(6)-L-threonylcarbamoyladenosine(37)-C(2))- methylthiotransferase MtaB n=1 Tax=Candidatus Electronema sp. PJ TaxID=3401572 RepID=UPI003AA9377E